MCIGIVLTGGSASAADPEPADGNFFDFLDFRDSPFIPIPEIGTDPNSGTMYGLLPVFLVTDEHREIRQIIAPDIIHDPNFGFGARGRIFGYPSDDTQWHVVGGLKQRVEREFDGLYRTGITRLGDWSVSAELVYDRSGTHRFYGIGNRSDLGGETTYVNEQAYLEGRIGWNASSALQVAYTLRPRIVGIEAGVLARIPSIETRFPTIGRLDTRHEFLNMISLTYDTRDSPDIPNSGLALVGYAGISDSSLGSSVSYSVAGIDARGFWPLAKDIVVATHVALRYMPTYRDAPFWDLGSLGGDRSILGGEQPLRGFGAGRFVDRNSFSASAELRYRLLDLQLFATDLRIELAPFVDVGRVFHGMSDNPLASLHSVGGLGFRALASPFIVGYVDVGYGSEGAAIFSGINYPF